MDDNITVTVKGTYMMGTASGPTPVVLLCDEDRLLPIYIGIGEAISINAALRNQITPRPMTHDLIISMLDNLNAKITDVLIDNLESGIYYARLTIQVNGEKKVLDARPSDCIALALRSRAEISVKKDIIERAGVDKDDIKGISILDL
jgi:hypothetical protein